MKKFRMKFHYPWSTKLFGQGILKMNRTSLIFIDTEHIKFFIKSGVEFSADAIFDFCCDFGGVLVLISWWWWFYSYHVISKDSFNVKRIFLFDIKWPWLTWCVNTAVITGFILLRPGLMDLRDSCWDFDAASDSLIFVRWTTSNINDWPLGE